MRHHIRVAPLTIFAAMALAVLLTGCSGSNSSDDAASTPTPTASSSPTATESATPTPTPTPKSKPRLYPKGYPKVVEVSSLPSQVRSWYEGSGNPKAVAVADGVWTELPPGAGMQDALATEVFDGFCGSIKAYSRKAGSRVICGQWKVTENAV